MTDIIQLLPDSIANQIAAGEVVQRPASVVKELMENAIDAKSKQIQVIIKEAGKVLIQVIDDGIGMSETDARMSFERHATSKIRKSEDLFTIRTMGFRGEALASIAAVAQVEMRTRREHEELGICIKVDGSALKQQEPVACPKGSSISVKNLFYNVPARRNFLKSNPVEMRHIIDEFQRVSLSNPEISFSLWQNDMEVYQLNTGKLSQRIVSIFGKNYQEQLAPCSEETQHLSVKGYIGKPEFSRKTRGEQYFFVNNRYIKNHYLHHAVLSAYEGLLPDESHPFYVLFIEIDPQHIDINVHPTKTEIKFDDERTVYSIIRAAVKQALGAHNITPSLDFEQDVNFHAITNSRLNHGREGLNNQNYEQFKPNSRQQENLNNWEKLYDANFLKGDFRPERETERLENPQEFAITFESAVNNNSSPGVMNQNLQHVVETSTFQLHQRYIITQVKSGMMLIDQQTAHERILYEKYAAALTRKSGASQQYLFPQPIELNPADFTLVMEMEGDIKALGFNFNIFGKNTLVINGGPADYAGGNEKELFEGLIEQFKKNRQELALEKRENLARSIARRSAIKPGQNLAIKEMRALIDQLFGCENPNYAPDGQVTFIILDFNKIANFFNK